MLVNEFDYQLPESHIARYPAQKRSQSRLLHVADDQLHDRTFGDVLDLLSPQDCLIVNNTRVMKARIKGQKATGGRVECLVERILTPQEAMVHLKSSKSPKTGQILYFGETAALMLGREGEYFHLRLQTGDWTTLLDAQGEMPLPPYIARAEEEADLSRYQTVYGEHLGAVAAPTAGLHFDETLLDAVKAKGVAVGAVTLHVGAGTFQNIRVDKVEDHQMHHEWLSVSQSVCDLIAQTKGRGGRVVAVGTTSVRALETAARAGELKPFEGDTNIFIYPGYQFKVVDALITNFHLPQSTLLMLVSAFSGKERIMRAYQHAIDTNYRFFSYGDAMFLSRQESL